MKRAINATDVKMDAYIALDRAIYFEEIHNRTASPSAKKFAEGLFKRALELEAYSETL